MTALLKRIFYIVTLTMLFMTVGCVGMYNKRPNQSWPKPVASFKTGQFDGVFKNYSLETKIDEVSRNQLFDFLTNQSHSHIKRGTEVEIQSSPDENVLRVRLLDQDRLEIDSAELHRGTNFDLTGGFINLHGLFLGARSEAGNIAVEAENESSRLYISSAGDLLGKHTSKTTGLLFYLIPFATNEKEWMLWSKVPQSMSK